MIMSVHTGQIGNLFPELCNLGALKTQGHWCILHVGRKGFIFLKKEQRRRHETIQRIQMQAHSAFRSIFKNQKLENPPSAGLKLFNHQIYLKTRLLYVFS